MTGSKALAYWTTTTIVLLALTISATIWQRKRDQTELETAAKVDRRQTQPQVITVQLRPAQSEETLRLIELDQQKRPRRIRIEWNNGLTCLVHCDGSGRPQQAHIYQQSKGHDDSNSPELSKDIAAGLSSRAVVRKTNFDKDGLTIMEERVLDADQTIRETATRLKSGDLVVNVYGPSSNLEAIRTYARKSGELIGETVFDGQGRVQSSLTKEGSNRVRRDLFGKSGGRTISFVYEGDRLETVIIWQSGGDLISETVKSEYSRTTRTVYENGKPSYECQKSYNDSMVVTHYDNAGNKICKQEWKNLPKDLPVDQQGLVSEGYYLAEVEELKADAAGNRRVLAYYPGGKNLKSVRTFKSSGWLPHSDKAYKIDGTLESYSSQDNGSYDTTDLYITLSDEAKAVLAKDDPDAVVGEAMKKIVSLKQSPTIESFNPPARGLGRSPFLKLD
jgi:hypothetical protein